MKTECGQGSNPKLELQMLTWVQGRARDSALLTSFQIGDSIAAGLGPHFQQQGADQ